MRRKGQEEMVGFVLIIVIVSVILLVFLGFSLRSSKRVEIISYEVQGFLQSVLRTTSDCEDAGGFLSVQKLIFSCDDEEICLDDRPVCEALNFTLNQINEETWNVGADAPIKGYELKILSENMNLSIQEGNVTQNYRGASELVPRRGESYDVSFKLYYG